MRLVFDRLTRIKTTEQKDASFFPDGKTWILNEAIKIVNVTENHNVLFVEERPKILASYVVAKQTETLSVKIRGILHACYFDEFRTNMYFRESGLQFVLNSNQNRIPFNSLRTHTRSSRMIVYIGPLDSMIPQLSGILMLLCLFNIFLVLLIYHRSNPQKAKETAELINRHAAIRAVFPRDSIPNEFYSYDPTSEDVGVFLNWENNNTDLHAMSEMLKKLISAALRPPCRKRVTLRNSHLAGASIVAAMFTCPYLGYD